MQNAIKSIALTIVVAAGTTGAASAHERAMLNPQPLPPICALARVGSPLGFLHALLYAPIGPVRPVCPPII